MTKKASRFAALALTVAMLGTLTLQSAAVGVSKAKEENSKIKNVIVLIPDGMSVDDVTLARWYKSYDAVSGTVDTSVSLALDKMASGLVRTYWEKAGVTGAITDSAPAATAMATGVKSNDKYIGVTYDQKPLATVLEAAKSTGRATGLVATSNIQHATPAGYSSHYPDRSKYEILAEQQVYNDIDVVYGAGSKYLAGRADNENMINTLKLNGYEYVTTRDQMEAVTSGKVWGMFAASDMAYEMDRDETAAAQPSLAEMTDSAIRLLSQDEDGFFLMVEGSKIDWAAHANDPIGVISDVLAFDDAVSVALDYAKAHQDTIVIAMTDHGNGGLTIGNADTSSTYSSDNLIKFIAPLKKATLTGEGVEKMLNADRSNAEEVMSTYYGISDLSDDEIAAIKAAPAGSMNYVVGPMISKRAYLGWTTTGHTGEDVVLFTYLPGDERITGTIDNTDVADICAGVWGVDLEALTDELYINASAAFEAKGATVTADNSNESNPKLVVTKGSTTLIIPESKNYVYVNGSQFLFDSVTVNVKGVFYVSREVVSLIA
ncbi:alkaline phosphatase [Papillibacter cinnamivorans]|nr:alkaline phosphatase [Papillibacter cinnamivorans]